MDSRAKISPPIFFRFDLFQGWSGLGRFIPCSFLAQVVWGSWWSRAFPWMTRALFCWTSEPALGWPPLPSPSLPGAEVGAGTWAGTFPGALGLLGRA